MSDEESLVRARECATNGRLLCAGGEESKNLFIFSRYKWKRRKQSFNEGRVLFDWEKNVGSTRKIFSMFVSCARLLGNMSLSRALDWKEFLIHLKESWQECNTRCFVVWPRWLNTDLTTPSLTDRRKRSFMCIKNVLKNFLFFFIKRNKIYL